VVHPPALAPLLQLPAATGGALEASGRLLAANHGNPGFDVGAEAALWDLSTRRRLWRAADTSLLGFDPRGRLLLGLRAGKQQGRALQVLDARTGAVRARWTPSFTTCGEGLAWGRDGVAVSDDDAIRLFREGKGLTQLGEPLPNHPGENVHVVGSCESCGGDALRLSPDGEILATSRRLFSWSTGREIARLAWTCAGAGHVGWSGDSRYLALGEGRSRVVAFRAADGRIAAESNAAGCGVGWIDGTHALSLRPLPTASALEVLRVDDGARLWLVPAPDGGIAAVSSAGDHDGTPERAALPEGVEARKACPGLVERFLAGRPCP
jgi:hypothetical protein